MHIDVTLKGSGHLQTKTEALKLAKNHVNFKKDECVLLVDKVDFVDKIDTFGLVRWTTVFDFDPKSWETGLYARIQGTIKKKASLRYVSWQDKDVTISEKSVTWIGVMGISNQSSTLTDDLSCPEWRKKTGDGWASQISELEKYAAGYTDLKVVVVWPHDDRKVKHFHKIIDRLIEIQNINVLVFLQSKIQRTKDERNILEILENEEKVRLIRLELIDLCNLINRDCMTMPSQHEAKYALPSSDGNCSITENEAMWLQTALEVLYCENMTGVEYTPQQRLAQERNFLRGGTLPWSAWYQLPKCNVERDIEWYLNEYLDSKHIKVSESGIVTLYHSPGAGGTTLAQSILWQQRRKLPCIHIKHSVDTSLNDIVERIVFIHTKTQLPVLVLVDGDERTKVETMLNTLESKACAIFLNVQRDLQCQHSTCDDNNFRLSNKLSDKEAKQIETQYLKQCQNNPQVERRLKQASWRKNPTLIDFGLAVYSYSYDGLEKYVANILNVKPEQEKLLPWQTALCYLAIVHFFGQSSLPCFFFTGLINREKIKTIDDFPDEMKELLVLDENEARSNMVRISHYYVSKEILNQLLPFPNKPKPSRSPGLTDDAKKNLAEPAIEFVQRAGNTTRYPRSLMAHIMIKTFITRKNTVDGNFEEMSGGHKKSRLSPFLEQVSEKQPFSERFSVMKQLAESFPYDAQFRAHLGRLYSICQPDDFQPAEKNMEIALRNAREAHELHSEIFDYSFDLMHICHMYGFILLQKVSQTTGKTFDRIKRSRTFEQNTCKIIPDVRRACQYFRESREHTPPGYANCLDYLDEIKIRLMFCHFVNKNVTDVNRRCDSLMTFVRENNSDVSKFVKECCCELDELFKDLYSSVDPRYIGSEIGMHQNWFSTLFQRMPGYSKNLPVDSINARKLEIVRIKMKYSSQSNPGMIESITDYGDIKHIADLLGKNIEEYYQGHGSTVSNHQQEFDFMEWIFVIRHPAIRDVPATEAVLQKVEYWNECIKSPMSRFYLFVLKSLVGFGTDIGSGNKELLRQAIELKDEVVKSRRFVKNACPKEWLGVSQNNFRRLLCFGRSFQNREVHVSKLELRRGTIVSSDRPSSGYIDLDLGPSNKDQVKVFFVPAQANASKGMVGSSLRGERVELYIRFTMFHGYEASHVKPLRQTKCPSCIIDIEALSKDNQVQCPRCKRMVAV